MQQTNQHLDAVMKARSAYIMAKRTLEAKLREQLNHEISNLQTQVDIAVRYAHNSGASKSSILRAMGTKDFFNTVSIEPKRSRKSLAPTHWMLHIVSMGMCSRFIT